MIKTMNVSMRPYSESEVLDFISKFGEDRTALQNEMDYWFAKILCERFDGILMYRPITRGFCALIGNDLYDASGKIERRSVASNDLHDWEIYKKYEPADCARIYHDAILKIPEPD